MISRVAFLIGLMLFVGCSGTAETNKLSQFSKGELTQTKAEFESFIEMWQEKIDSGEWDQKIEDGTAEADSTYFGELKDYPQFKIDKFKNAITEFDAELKRRWDNGDR